MSGHPLEPIGVPDFAEPLEAWRTWRVVVDKSGCRLGSIMKPTLWPFGDALVAECLRAGAVGRWFRRRCRKHHDAPATRCQCGIYGAGLRDCEQYLSNWPMEPRAVRVLGQVSLWGTVIECERGFRASHAYPLRIFVPADSAPRPDQRCEGVIAGLEAYGVPVELLPAGCSEAIDMLERTEPAGRCG